MSEMENKLNINVNIRKALIISVSEYSSHNLVALGFCRNDGQKMYEILNSIGYRIDKSQLQIGKVRYESMRNAIMDFFTDPNVKAEDTLLFYYSGHGIPDAEGDIYLASSEINPDFPYKKGFSFSELTKMIQRSTSIRTITILDCCYSGAAKLGKGHEEDSAKIGISTIENQTNALQQGEGKCILAASQATQEAFALSEGDHSIFTYYLLEGLNGNEKSVDAEGNVTPYSLGAYIYKSILNLPIDKRPKQKPITKVEASGEIILASYPHLSKYNRLGNTNSMELDPDSRKSYLERNFNSNSKTNKITSVPKSDSKKLCNQRKLKILISFAIVISILIPVAFVYYEKLPGNSIISNAGGPQIVNAYDSFHLDGSKSKDSIGNISSYSWKQISGPIANHMKVMIF